MQYTAQNIIGIYKITSPTDKTYIGQSKCILSRWERYRKGRCEQQRKLFHSLIKYGWYNHIFEIVEECSIEDLNCRERYWQDFYEVSDRDKGLNSLLTGCNDLVEQILKLERKTNKVLKISAPIVRNPLGFHKIKLVLDTQTGVFYNSIKELCELYGYKYDTIKSKLNGKLKNNTQFIYA